VRLFYWKGAGSRCKIGTRHQISSQRSMIFRTQVALLNSAQRDPSSEASKGCFGCCFGLSLVVLVEMPEVESTISRREISARFGRAIKWRNLKFYARRRIPRLRYTSRNGLSNAVSYLRSINLDSPLDKNDIEINITAFVSIER